MKIQLLTAMKHLNVDKFRSGKKQQTLQTLDYKTFFFSKASRRILPEHGQ